MILSTRFVDLVRRTSSKPLKNPELIFLRIRGPQTLILYAVFPLYASVCTSSSFSRLLTHEPGLRLLSFSYDRRSSTTRPYSLTFSLSLTSSFSHLQSLPSRLFSFPEIPEALHCASITSHPTLFSAFFFPLD